jgi:hypothetical protein
VQESSLDARLIIYRENAVNEIERHSHHPAIMVLFFGNFVPKNPEN